MVSDTGFALREYYLAQSSTLQTWLQNRSKAIVESKAQRQVPVLIASAYFAQKGTDHVGLERAVSLGDKTLAFMQTC